MKLLLGLILFLTFSFTVGAQQTLRGRVLNADDRKPLPFANVFLANTTRGTTTNEEGEFTLTPLPTGSLELVVSYVGYQTQTQTIQTDNRSASLEILLKANPELLAEVKVKTKRDKHWKQRYERFVSMFLGATENARQCTILNSDVLWITEDSTKQWLTAGAREPLIIENQALGYRIKYQLEGFSYHQTQGYVSYLGYPVYEELSTTSSETMTRWKRNRNRAYYGSLTHFLRSLHNGTLASEGFIVQRMANPAHSPMNALALAGKKLSRSEVDRYRSYQVLEEPLRSDDLLIKRLHTTEQSIMTFPGAIQVTYTKEMDFPSRPGMSQRPQTSVIELLSQMVRVQANGQYFPSLDLLVSGYFVYEKTGDSLPFDFQPYP
ncbi:carboxypeptidase-like regulatory domain-containing protein [Siphonobacter sp.]|uniref:carboxypeptidase-like regulatory domain-containing protein n=1 Tax=Siphonobacter sp. TaxID=1869184 RepID=UPI003B3A60E5